MPIITCNIPANTTCTQSILFISSTGSNNTNVTSCKTGDIRLVGGQTIYEGRVEICIDRIWGTVCGLSWGIPDSNVVCKQLGHIGLG